MKLVLRRTSLRPDTAVGAAWAFRRRNFDAGLLRVRAAGRPDVPALGRSRVSNGYSMQRARHHTHRSPSAAIVARRSDRRSHRDPSGLGVSVVVVEGTEESSLRRAAGHIAGTALPGQPGNVGIAGHRDTFFRPLRNVRHGDIIILATLRGEYRYHVVSTEVVKPDNVAVLRPNGHEILTLVTCYPFYFVGPAPDRFVVRAERTQPEIVAVR